MAKILYSATDPDGQEAAGFVDADSARGARDKLIGQGLANVVLHQEPAISMDPALLAGLDAAALRHFARFQLRLRRDPGLATVLTEVARRAALLIAIDLAVVAWAATQRQWWLCAAFGAFLLYPFVMTIWRRRHVDHFQQMLKDFALGRWDDAERAIARLAPVRSRSQLLDFDLDVRRASIRARRGDLPGALQMIEPWRTKLAARPGLFEARASAVHASAGDRAAVVRLMGDAYEASNHEPARAIDYALILARFGDVEHAASVMAGVDKTLLQPAAKAYVPWAEGQIQLRRGAIVAAVAHLAAAQAEFLQRAEKPAVWTSLAFCTCDHALALDAAGRRDDARKALAPVLPILLAHADEPLLRVLRKDLISPPSAG